MNKALDSEIDDVEDAVIEISAIDNSVDFVLTRNIKDFKKSKVPAKTPEELLAMMN